jgi:hypothetical protein
MATLAKKMADAGISSKEYEVAFSVVVGFNARPDDLIEWAKVNGPEKVKEAVEKAAPERGPAIAKIILECRALRKATLEAARLEAEKAKEQAT